MELQTIEQMMIVDYQGALINWDNKKLIELANNTVNKYKNLVVTADMTKDIKKEVATLNKLIKSIDDKRKTIKKDYNSPLSIFEGNVKEVTTIINTAVDDLKKQLDIFEQIRRDEKKTLILRALNSIGANEFLHLGVEGTNKIIIHESFYNETIKIKDIEDDIRNQYILLNQQYELEQLKIKQEQERIEREAIERENKIKARYELINKMNAETGCEFNYNSTKHYNDADLMLAYQKAISARVSVEKMKQEELNQQKSLANELPDIVDSSIRDNIILNQKVKNTYSLLIENLTKQQMDLIILGLKQKMPLVKFKEV